MTTSPRLGYTELTASQAVPETTVNEIARILEAFANATHFKSRANNPAQPGSPADGDCYLLTGTPTGTSWAGHGGKIAIYVNTAWTFITAKEGFIAWVDDEDVLVGYTGSAWNTLVSGTAITVDNDTTLAGNSAINVPSQHAVKTYVDTAVTGLLDLKGGQDCSANPNYPAASKGDYYFVTVAGKIGGASGTTVAVGDVYFATADNAGGTQASVGSSWDILVHASVSAGGGLLAANNLSDLASAATARSNLGLGAAATHAIATAAEVRAGTASRIVESDVLQAAMAPQVLTDGATVSWDMSTAINAKVTLGGNRTLAVSNPVVGATYSLGVIQDGTGSRTFTWPASFDWGTTGAPTLTTTASKRDSITLFCTDAAAPKFDAFLSGKGFS